MSAVEHETTGIDDGMNLWRYDDKGMDCWRGWGVWTHEHLASKDQNEFKVDDCSSTCTPAFSPSLRRINVSGFDICFASFTTLGFGRIYGSSTSRSWSQYIGVSIILDGTYARTVLWAEGLAVKICMTQSLYSMHSSVSISCSQLVKAVASLPCMLELAFQTNVIFTNTIIQHRFEDSKPQQETSIQINIDTI